MTYKLDCWLKNYTDVQFRRKEREKYSFYLRVSLAMDFIRIQGETADVFSFCTTPNKRYRCHLVEYNLERDETQQRGYFLNDKETDVWSKLQEVQQNNSKVK